MKYLVVLLLLFSQLPFIQAVINGYPSTAVIPCGNWTLFSQCDPRWGSQELGVSSDTICSAGCAMSSTSMALNHHSLDVSPGVAANPATLNAYLNAHNGYVDGDDIEWNSTAPLGMTMEEYLHSDQVTSDDLKKWVLQCQPVVVNVRGGSHWVLVIGYDTKSATTFYVNDPGYTNLSYDYSGMLKFVVYAYNK